MMRSRPRRVPRPKYEAASLLQLHPHDDYTLFLEMLSNFKASQFSFYSFVKGKLPDLFWEGGERSREKEWAWRTGGGPSSPSQVCCAS